jgi:predicted acyltransferase (DUF342 family)
VANGADIILGGSTYVEGYIDISNDNYINGGQNVIADGDITIGNNSGVNYGVALEEIPFLISTGGSIDILNNAGTTWAILYANPNAVDGGEVNLAQGVELVGSAVGRTVHLQQDAEVIYPIEFRSRTDLPGTGGSTSPIGLRFNSYTINP